jgi:predicted dithiol-disulfide oxidoreductase (DUF899 family)
MTDHRTASREEYDEARRVLLDREKDLTRRGDELTRERQALPWVAIDKRYVFDTVGGPRTLPELFAGRSQLLVHHIMFEPDWDEGCVTCSLWAESWDGAIPHLAARDVTLLAASSAPLDKLWAYRERMGWRFDWVSTNDGDFGKDFGTSFVARQADPQYNYRPLEGDFSGDLPGMSSFVLDSGRVFHTYSSYARGMEAFCTTYQLLDRAPRGRNEDDLPRPQAWVRRHDEYDRAGS